MLTCWKAKVEQTVAGCVDYPRPNRKVREGICRGPKPPKCIQEFGRRAWHGNHMSPVLCALLSQTLTIAGLNPHRIRT
jgi:hypothetical protein